MSEPDPLNIPSSLSMKLIRLWCNQDLYEEIEGNLIEFYNEQKKPKKLRSKLSYWFQVFSYLRPGTFKKFQNHHFVMFNFNPKLTIRNLWNNRASTAINIGGFSLGLLCVFYLYFYVSSELNTDSFHTNKDQIYRILRIGELKGVPYKIGVTSGPYAEGLRTDYPGTIKATSRVWLDEGLVRYEDNVFNEERLAFVDKNFFEFFSFPLKTGNPSTVFSNPNSVVISTEMAKKYFGDKDPVGKVLTVDNQFEFMVSGVMDEFPGKSHLQLDMAFPVDIFNQYEWFQDWWSNSLITYVMIETPAEVAKVEATFDEFMDKYFGKDFEASGNRIGLMLEPMSETYFNNDARYDPAFHGDINTIYILIMVAIAIMFIACFNYVNLSIAQSFKRSKEVGVRKIIGGSDLRLTVQFMGEVILMVILSMGFAILLAVLLTPTLNGYFGLDVQLIWNDPAVIYFLGGLFLITILLSGLYPALQMSGFKPLNILRGTHTLSSNSLLRKSLVIGQFVISILLIASTLLVSSQLEFLNSKELGFRQDAILIVNINNSDMRDNLETFKTELLGSSYVQNVTLVTGEPGGFHDASSFKIEGVQETIRMRTLMTDHNYLTTFEVELVGGSDFKDIVLEGSNGGIILNETAVKELGIEAESLLGRHVEMPGWDIERTIVGIVDDFHFQSLHDKIEPLAIIQGGRARRIVVKMNAQNQGEGLALVIETYEKISPSYPISYSFLDESLYKLYNGEKKQSHVFTVFSGISIFLACLGVLGLTSYSARQRQKEFGIRKVLGASISSIIGLISWEFLILISISTLIAIPIAAYFLSKWLSDFAYQIDLVNHWPLFLISGISAAVIAWLSIGIMTYRAAILKPTECIRNE